MPRRRPCCDLEPLALQRLRCRREGIDVDAVVAVVRSNNPALRLIECHLVYGRADLVACRGTEHHRPRVLVILRGFAIEDRDVKCGAERAIRPDGIDRYRPVIGGAFDDGFAVAPLDANGPAHRAVIADDDPRVGLVDPDAHRHAAHRGLCIEVLQGPICTIDGEGHHATPHARHAAEPRSAIHTIEEASIHRRAHAVAVEILHFSPGGTDRLHRAIRHVHAEDVDTTARRCANESRRRSSHIGVELPLCRQRIPAEGGAGQDEPGGAEECPPGDLAFHCGTLHELSSTRRQRT